MDIQTIPNHSLSIYKPTQEIQGDIKTQHNSVNLYTIYNYVIRDRPLIMAGRGPEGK